MHLRHTWPTFYPLSLRHSCVFGPLSATQRSNLSPSSSGFLVSDTIWNWKHTWPTCHHQVTLLHICFCNIQVQHVTIRLTSFINICNIHAQNSNHQVTDIFMLGRVFHLTPPATQWSQQTARHRPSKCTSNILTIKAQAFMCLGQCCFYLTLSAAYMYTMSPSSHSAPYISATHMSNMSPSSQTPPHISATHIQHVTIKSNSSTYLCNTHVQHVTIKSNSSTYLCNTHVQHVTIKSNSSTYLCNTHIQHVTNKSHSSIYLYNIHVQHVTNKSHSSIYLCNTHVQHVTIKSYSFIYLCNIHIKHPSYTSATHMSNMSLSSHTPPYISATHMSNMSPSSHTPSNTSATYTSNIFDHQVTLLLIPLQHSRPTFLITKSHSF